MTIPAGPRTVTLLFLLAALTACQTQRQAYDGPRRSDGDVAIVHPNPVGARVAFVVTSVDGREMDARFDEVAMLPGDRTLDLIVTPAPLTEWRMTGLGRDGHLPFELDRREKRIMQLTFTATPGARYALDGARTMDGVIEDAWLVDRVDGSIVTHAVFVDRQ